MNPEKLLKQVNQLETLADTMKEICLQIKEQLGVMATLTSNQKGKYAATVAKALAKRNETISKRSRRK